MHTHRKPAEKHIFLAEIFLFAGESWPEWWTKKDRPVGSVDRGRSWRTVGRRAVGGGRSVGGGRLSTGGGQWTEDGSKGAVFTCVRKPPKAQETSQRTYIKGVSITHKCIV